MPLSFALSSPILHSLTPPDRLCNCTVRAAPVPRRPRRAVVRCNAAKLLVVDLQEVLRPSEVPAADVQAFSERVKVDRKSSQNTTFVLYSSHSGYDASMRSIHDADLVEPDALATLDGTELYQRQYSAPDPYWAQQVCTGWTSKPVQWVVNTFFADEVADVNIDEEFVVKIRSKGATPSADFCNRLRKKLDEMGMSARVVMGEENALVLVVPASGSAGDVVAFCQSMLGIGEDSTFVFGSDNLLNTCVQGKGYAGLCGAGSQHNWDAFEGRVFVSKNKGITALLDGVVHHAIF